jgi:RNA polymerase sigma factor (sigma-70 family)
MDQQANQPEGVIPINGQLPSHNFGLMQHEFDLMLAQLTEGKEDLFEHIFLKHFDDCRKFISSKYTMDYETSYDVTMDTMLEFRLKLLHGKIRYGNLRYLFTRMASNNFVKQLSLEQRMKQMLTHDDIDEEYHEDRFDQLDKAWKELDSNDRDLLTQYYYEDKSLKDIAATTQINDATLRKKKQRAMDSLRTVFFKNFNH